MNILFLSLSRAEKIRKDSIYHSLLLKFAEYGHNVYMVAPRERKTNLPTEVTSEHNMNILKVRTGNIVKTNIIEKGISTLQIEKQYLNAINQYFGSVRFDLIIYATPPITFTKLVSKIKKRDNARSYLLLKDIFPQNAIDIQLLKKSNPIYWFFRHKERELYRVSDYIGCMSPANMNYILNNNQEISEDNVEVNPNTIEPQNISISEEHKRNIRAKYALPQDKSIFIYGGNLGKPQGIDFLIECIQRNEKNKNSYFLVVGSGTEFNKLENYFKSEQPKNAKLLSQLPKEDYELLANTCDVGLIFLDNRFTIPNFPSRLLSYMQASMPVLAATDPNTDIGKIIEEGNFGYWCVSDNVEKFNDLVLQLSNKDLQEKLGKNARKYLEDNYTSQHSYDIIMSHFN